MGLLDSLNYNGGSGGGLLDALFKMGLMPSDQAQYGQPPQQYAQAAPQAMAQMQPNPAPMRPPQAAPQFAAPQQQPALQPQQAAPPQDQGLGFLDRLNQGFQSIGNGGSIIGALTGNRTDPQSIASANNNITARALLAKGIDPQTVQAAMGNTELLHTLITQTFGPKRQPMNLGSGYILPEGATKATRLFEPDDKIPAGFTKDDNGNMHFIPNGPADPAYQRLLAAQKSDPNAVHVLGRGGELYKVDDKGNPTVVHKNQETEGEPLTDAAVSLAADRAIAGDSKALTNLGRGAQGRADLVKINNAIAEKMKDNPNAAKQIQQNVAQQAGLVSSSRALGTKETHFGVAEKAMEESIPLAQAASDAVPRSDWMAVNKLIQTGQTQHSNPALKKFLIANDTAVKDYARTINPTGALRESDIEYARKTLSTADGPEAYTAGLAQLQQEAGVMHRAIQRQKTELQGGTPTPAPSSPKGALPAGNYVWSPDKGVTPK